MSNSVFNSVKVVEAYKNLFGWRQSYDTSVVIQPDLLLTESNEYFEQKHPALVPQIIQTLLPKGREINAYLREKVADASNEIFNDLIQYRQLGEFGKTLLEQSVLLNKYGWTNDTITNQNRFVGLQIRPRAMTGLQAIIEEIGLQFTGVESFILYLFHSSQLEPLHEIDVTTTGNGNWTWSKQGLELSSFLSEQYQGGVFVLGYYQEDITSNAINYTNFNWNRGVCGGCNDSHKTTWDSINKNFSVYPIYVPSGSFDKGEMFDLQNALYSADESFGINLKFTVKCDLTDFFIQNRFTFKNLLALKMVSILLNDMKFSQQINAIEENIKMMIIRDLEGDVDTKLTNIPTQYQKELKAVSFNISGMNPKCLGCTDQSYAPTYGTV